MQMRCIWCVRSYTYSIPKHLWPSWWHVIVFLYVGLRGFGIIYCEHSAKRKKDIIYVYNIRLESHHNRAIQCIFACGFSFWFDEFAVMFIIIALLCVVLFTPEIKEKEKKMSYNKLVIWISHCANSDFITTLSVHMELIVVQLEK